MSFLDILYSVLMWQLYGFPVVTFFTAGLCALAWCMWQRLRRGRSLSWRLIGRIFSPLSLVRTPSARVDIGFLLLSMCVFPLFFSYFMINDALIEKYVTQALVFAFGVHAPLDMPQILVICALTCVSFLAYEIGYWIDHYLSHNVPFLWAFHKVHHTAHNLSPLTNYRVHPVDSIVFVNILALCGGLSKAVFFWAVGCRVTEYHIAGVNMFIFLGIAILAHLQHTHFWIAFTGVWGKIFVSPAHHQLHHSDNSAHFDCNYGSFLAVWDWLAGTLIVPSSHRRDIHFGVKGDASAGSLYHNLITPFALCFAPMRSVFVRFIQRMGLRFVAPPPQSH